MASRARRISGLEEWVREDPMVSRNALVMLLCLTSNAYLLPAGAGKTVLAYVSLFILHYSVDVSLSAQSSSTIFNSTPHLEIVQLLLSIAATKNGCSKLSKTSSQALFDKLPAPTRSLIHYENSISGTSNIHPAQHVLSYWSYLPLSLPNYRLSGS